MYEIHGADFFEADGPPLCVFRMPKHFPEEATIMHTHDVHELMILTEGQTTHVLNGKEYPLLPGDVYLMHPGEYHTFRCEPSETMTEINLLFDFM
jgi:quercetin dioxygenase-like cupin family protein|tara:strand:+ start:48 stop:332 length:285 start_codon:yes stop_codon:yes gene_type:complete